MKKILFIPIILGLFLVPCICAGAKKTSVKKTVKKISTRAGKKPVKPKPVPPAYTVPVAINGISRAQIILDTNAKANDILAADELSTYLHRICGSPVPVVQAPSGGMTGIYIGESALSILKTKPGKLEDDEWMIETYPGKILLTGGGSLGNLYAAYHFLEDIAGVRWWTPTDEYVPSLPTLKVQPLKMRKHPALKCRILDIRKPSSPEYERFCLRNRLTQNETIIGDYIHSFIHPEDWQQHPEWFSYLFSRRRNGKNLCLTNPDMRSEFASRILKFIDESGKSGHFVLRLYPPENAVYCKCESCYILFAAQSAESALLIDFINFIAGKVKEKYPGAVIETLAYQDSRTPPKNLKPAGNVRIIYCADPMNQCRSFVDPSNSYIYRELTNWCALTSGVLTRFYCDTDSQSEAYTPDIASEVGPTPSVFNIGPDLRAVNRLNSGGVIYQQEMGLARDMPEMKNWLRAKLLEDPALDDTRLIADFTDGYYGKAGALVRQYLNLLTEAEKKSPSHIWLYSETSERRYLNTGFLTSADKLFTDAESLTENDNVLLHRLRLARLPIDRAILYLWPSLIQQWPQGMQPSRSEILSRYMNTISDTDPNQLKQESRLLQTLDYKPYPYKRPSDMQTDALVIDCPADSISWKLKTGGNAVMIDDPASEIGKAVRISGPGFDAPVIVGLGSSWGDDDLIRYFTKYTDSESKYQLIKLGKVTIGGNSFIYFGKDHDLCIRFLQSGVFNIWASIKLDKEPKDNGGIRPVLYIDRLLISPAEDQK